jgi:hypothetical protein
VTSSPGVTSNCTSGVQYPDGTLCAFKCDSAKGYVLDATNPNGDFRYSGPWHGFTIIVSNVWQSRKDITATVLSGTVREATTVHQNI